MGVRSQFVKLEPTHGHGNPHLGLCLLGDGAEERRRAGQERRVKGRRLCRGAGVALTAAEIAVGVWVSRGQKSSPLGTPLGIRGGKGAVGVAVEKALLASGMGRLHQGGKAIGGLRFGDIGQRHGGLRLGVCIGADVDVDRRRGTGLISTLYLDDVPVC